jgi:hypothetical protein
MKSLELVVRQSLSDPKLYNHCCIPTSLDDERICLPDNITMIPNYRTIDSLCYLESRCNYCGKRWGEFWISYRYIFLSLIEQHYQRVKYYTQA